MGDIIKLYISLTQKINYRSILCLGLEFDDIDESIKDFPSKLYPAIVHRLKVIKKKLEYFKSSQQLFFQVQFKKLKTFIIDEIRKSKNTIDIAVAWISDDEIIRELLLASRKNVNIRILTTDYQSNKNALRQIGDVCDIKFIESYGKEDKNIMHNKFCVFDSKIVITGSYNWSKNANKNKENITIISSEAISREYLKEFNQLNRCFK